MHTKIRNQGLPYPKLIIVVVVVVSAASCTLEMEQPGAEIGTSRQSVSATNALAYNRLVYNRLVYNQLAGNRLVYNELSENRLIYNSLDNLEATAEGRELLFYIARCALGADDILVTQHAGTTYEFPGLLGLATDWVNGPLSGTKARRVSACLIAHVNAYGVSVLISLRGDGVLTASPSEITEFPLYEATFFGDVFGSSLRTYACLGGNGEIATALSTSRPLRACADPSLDCQVEALGYCRDICEQRSRHYGWTDCWANGVRYRETLSSFLQADLGTSCQQACRGSDECAFDCESQASILDCSRYDQCSVICDDRSYCTVTSMFTDAMRARVHRGSFMEIDCHGVDQCQARCGGADTRCEIDCQGADRCRSDVFCEGGAQCMLQCTGSDQCGFARCDGALRSCPGGIVVCNQACPGGR
jgi:hypothetical protein